MKLNIFILFSCLILLSKSMNPPNELSKNEKNITWAVFGDSLTEYNFRANSHYFDYVAKELNLKIINLGVSSTGYKEDGVAESFYKRMERSIKSLTIDVFRKVKPLNKIGLVTPTIWRDGVYYGDVPVTRKDLDDYVEALLQIAKLKRIPILDLYHDSGLDPNIDIVLEKFYQEDGIQDAGVHPNSLGHKFMYPLWREFIKQFIDYL